MGLDLELADVAAARHRHADCHDSGTACSHDPHCAEHLDALEHAVQLKQPGYAHSLPWEFPYRRFSDIADGMLLTGMGYEAEPCSDTGCTSLDEATRLAGYEAWRSQTTPGKAGIPLFKLRSNDRWLVTVREVDEALAAYGEAPATHRELLESGPKWNDWLEWLVLSREHGGFEAE